MWGREAWHLTQFLVEPVYFVSGLNFPIARLGILGSVAIALLPLAVGLDAMRQLAFADAAYPLGTPSPGDRGAHPRRDDRRLPAARPLDAPRPRAAGAQGRPPVGALAMSGIGRARSIRAWARPPGAASTQPDPRPRRGRHPAQLRDGCPARLADGGELDRSAPVLHLLGREARGLGPDPRRHARGHQRRRQARVPRLRRHRQRAVGVRHVPGSPGSPGASSTTASATGC